MMTVLTAIKVALVCALLAGCATNRIGTEGIKAFYCGAGDDPGAYVPVRWSRQDTDETIAQVKQNHAVWSDVCK